MKKEFTKFNKLNFSEKLIIIESSIILLIVRFLIKIFGFKTTHYILNKLTLFSVKVKNEKLFIKKAGNLIKGASKVLPIKTTCVEDSITLWLMLKNRGIDSYLKIGVNQNTDKLDAHAWVEIDGYVISETESINKPFSGFKNRFFYEKK